MGSSILSSNPALEVITRARQRAANEAGLIVDRRSREQQWTPTISADPGQLTWAQTGFELEIDFRRGAQLLSTGFG